MKIKIKTLDEILINNICIIYILYMLLDSINIIFNISNLSKINYILSLITIIITLIILIINGCTRWIYISLFFSVIWLLTSLCFPQNIDHFQYRLLRFTLYCYPIILCISEIRKFELLYEKLYKYINIIFIYSIILFIYSYILKNQSSYNGSISHMLAISCVFYIDRAIENKRYINIINIIYCIILILTVGQRNSLLLVAIYTLLKIINHLYNKKKIRNIITIIITIIIFSLFYRNIIDIIIYLIEKLNLNSRTLNLILKGEFLQHDSGRNIIYSTVLEGLKESPLLGLGLCGDSVVASKNGINIYYAHSIIIEMWISFGYILGSIILIYLGIKIIKSVFNKNSYKNRLILIFGGISISSLLFNSSFWISIEFWIFIMLLFSGKKEVKNYE